MKISSLSVVYSVLLIASTAFAESSTTVTGVISESMCGAHHMMKDVSAAQCIRVCVKQGSDFALVVGDKVYTLKGDKAQFDRLAGQTVTIKGSMSGSTINVSALEPSKEKGRP